MGTNNNVVEIVFQKQDRLFTPTKIQGINLLRNLTFHSNQEFHTMKRLMQVTVSRDIEIISQVRGHFTLGCKQRLLNFSLALALFTPIADEMIVLLRKLFFS